MKDYSRILPNHRRSLSIWLLFNVAQSCFTYLPRLIKGISEFSKLTPWQNVSIFLFSTIIAEGWILMGDVGILTRNKSAIETFDDWNATEITAQISLAKKSIVIIDSYFDEAANLEKWVQAAINSGANHIGANDFKIDVSIYMVSPQSPFGDQRNRERDHSDPSNGLENYKKILWDAATRAPEDMKGKGTYSTDFQNCVGELKHRGLTCDKKHIILSVYEYPTMPSMRLLIVDDKKFFFGWFPLRAHNPSYICFALCDGSLTKSDQEVVRRLRAQYECMRKISKIVPVEGEPCGESRASGAS